MHGQVLKGHTDGLMLAALSHGPAHGYAIIELLRAESNGALDLPEGTVYPALHRMEHAGLVRSRWAREAGRRRRVYQVTPEGRRELDRQRGEWRQFAGAMHAIFEGGT
jgi:PadR family transcriptional regulator PadR